MFVPYLCELLTQQELTNREMAMAEQRIPFVMGGQPVVEYIKRAGVRFISFHLFYMSSKYHSFTHTHIYTHIRAHNITSAQHNIKGYAVLYVADRSGPRNCDCNHTIMYEQWSVTRRGTRDDGKWQ